MKKLLNTLYVSIEDAYLSLDGENIIVTSDGEKIGRFPLHNLENIVSVGYRGVSPALIGKCANDNISLNFISRSGRLLGSFNGESKGNVLLRKEQYRISDTANISLEYSRNFIIGKLYNSKYVLERITRDYPLRVDVDKIKKISAKLSSSIKDVYSCSSLDSLRGIEGEAASQYFSVFDEMILQQKDEFVFSGRNKRPPKDNVNALLSLSYTLLSIMCASALEVVGLDAYVGFMHTDRPGRRSLALDLMEELRSIFADRFVLTLINKKIISPNDFLQSENGAVLLTDNGRKKFFSEWQKKKMETITHPFLKEKMEWGVVPYSQALLLSRAIRGDLDGYPPFLWK